MASAKTRSIPDLRDVAGFLGDGVATLRGRADFAVFGEWFRLWPYKFETCGRR